MDTTIKEITKRPVTDEDGVRNFIYHCIHTFQLSIGFHPDTLFKDYVDKDNGNKPIFSRRECMALDYVLRECHGVCFQLKLDIRAIWLEIYQPEWDRLEKGKPVAIGDLIAKQYPTNIPEPRITSDDEKMIDMYKLVLDKKAGRLECATPGHDDRIKVREFLGQRYVRVLTKLELALCAELKVLFPDDFETVSSAFKFHTQIKGNEL